MPLTIIKGPPNSGRTEQVRREYMDLLPSGPIMVVPGVDDIFDWERRLARGRDAFLGGRIMHFKDLISEVLDLSPGTQRRTASPLERQRIVETAFRNSWPELSDRLRRQTGLAESMLKLIDEFRQSLIDPDTLDEKLEEIESGYLEKVAAVYRNYVEELDARKLTDSPALAMASAKVDLKAWQGRPIFMVGFDDLTNQQLELAVRLAEQTSVTVAITHEDGNPAMAVTDTLLARLVERGGTVRETTERPAEPTDHGQLLHEVERDFMRPGTPGTLRPDDSVTVMRSTGTRGEAEAVAARIATLIDAGTDPGQIAIGISSPAKQGRVFRDLLTEYSIPVSLESETSASETAVGRGVLALLRASAPNGSAADFIRYLRGPTGQDPAKVDELEFRVIRNGVETARAAAGIHAEISGGSPPGWDRINTGEITETVAETVLTLSEVILDGDEGFVPSDASVTEVRIAKAIGAACAELESMDDVEVSNVVIADAIRSGAVKTWSVPTVGAVRISSPYSLRAKRFEHLFMVSLQEGGMSAADRSGPFLSADIRGQIGLPEFVDPELQELYLFYSCLSVPTRSLWLSSRVADDSGKAEHPSPLVAAVERLFPPDSIRRHGRSAEANSFPVSEAPSLTELGRSMAAARAISGNPRIEFPDLPDNGDSESIRRQIDAAVAIETETRTLASLTSETALAILAERTTFSATALEAFAGCPYGWFIERAVRPVRFGPEPEPIARGQLTHQVLAEIYGKRLGSIPGPEDVDEWVAEVEPAVMRVVAKPEIRLDSDSAAHKVARRRSIDSISRFLRIESVREGYPFRPAETEVAFGMKDDAPIDMGSWSLRGSIDRVDAAGGKGVVIDYKTGASGTLALADIKKQRKLQVQLYMLAMKQRLGLEPAAGLYVPILVEPKEARGIVDEAAAGDLAGLDGQGKDQVPEIGDEITSAVDEAGSIVSKILAGDIAHSHFDCVRHLEHPAVPDPLLEEIFPEPEGAGQ